MPARWTKGEVQFLHDNHTTMTALEIAEKLEKSHRSVTQKATYEGVLCVLRSKDGVKKGWTKAELNELMVLAEQHSIAVAAGFGYSSYAEFVVMCKKAPEFDKVKFSERLTALGYKKV